MSTSNSERAIHFNEDDAHFYSCHPSDDMSVKGLNDLVDYYAEGTQVASILFNVTMQKALFDSKTRQPLYDGYDPDGPEDQPLLRYLEEKARKVVPGDHGRNWVHNLWLLNRARGIDQFKVWLERCKKHGIEGWITARMNDAHGLKERAMIEKGEAKEGNWLLLCQSKFWMEHPELRRAPYRYERSWEGAFDYAKELVRQEQLRFYDEVLGRYDMDGLELDWMRWGMNFAPGHEQAGRPILTAFVADIRRMVDGAAKRLGRPVKLGVRVPSTPEICLDLGYDVPAWVEQGLVDQVVLSSFGGSANFEYPIELWRRLLGKKIRLLTHGSDVVIPYPGCQHAGHIEAHFGTAASALQRGSDGIYYFNECYSETKAKDRDNLSKLLRTAGSLSTLAKVPRAHVTTYPGMALPGTSIRTLMPIPLIQRHVGSDFSRFEENISVRIDIGSKPASGVAVLHFGFSPEVKIADSAELTVRINTQILKPLPPRNDSLIHKNRIGWQMKNADTIGTLLSYEIPADFLHDGGNVVEFVPPQIEGELRWAEIDIP